MIDDLAAFGAPVLLFSGGEPLLREDLCELGAYARSRGPPHGHLDQRLPHRPGHGRADIKDAGFSYVGVSLDGIRATNDRFRGSDRRVRRRAGGHAQLHRGRACAWACGSRSTATTWTT